MGLRELKEVANQQFVRGKFAQCAQTYQQILRMAPRDPNMRVRHAEACRRSGDRLQAIASYRAAADLLLELGCESRARGALKAALELDPRDPILQADVARLGVHHEEAFPASFSENEELPLLPPLESGVDPIPPAPRAARPFKVTLPEDPLRTTALPPIHRALPAAPSVASLGPPVLLPAPRASSSAAGTALATSGSRTEKMGAAMASAAGALASTLPRSANAVHRTPAPRPPAAPPSQRPVATGLPPPVLQPVAPSALPPRSGPSGTPMPGSPAGTSLPPRSATGRQAQAARPLTPPVLQAHPGAPSVPAAAAALASSVRAGSSAPRNVMAPPPTSQEALFDASRVLSAAQALPALATPEPSKDSGPRLEVRRLSASALAFRCLPNDSWAVIRSHTPLEMHLVEDLEQLPPMLRDFTVDITVNSETEAAPSTVH
jgi:hypothetical protein